MDPTMWDCQMIEAGCPLSNFQRQVLEDVYGGREVTRRDRRAGRTLQRSSWPNATVLRPASPWPGLALVSVLALLPLVMSIYSAL